MVKYEGMSFQFKMNRTAAKEFDSEKADQVLEALAEKYKALVLEEIDRQNLHRTGVLRSSIDTYRHADGTWSTRMDARIAPYGALLEFGYKYKPSKKQLHAMKHLLGYQFKPETSTGGIVTIPQRAFMRTALIRFEADPELKGIVQTAWKGRIA